jgi:hypothetical protein
VGIKGYGATADGEFGPQFADVAADFRLLGNAAPVVLELQGTKKLQSAIEEENIPGRNLSFDRWDVLVMFPPAMAKQPSWAEPTGPPFRPPVTSGHKEGRFVQIEEGLYYRTPG